MQQNAQIAARPIEGQVQPASPERPAADPESASCPWCGEGRADPEWPNRGSAEFWLEHCAVCGLVYTVPQLSAGQIAGYYSQSYYGDCNVRFHALLESLVGRLRRRRAERLRRMRKEPGAVLDIGCGRGHFLDWLRAWGWTCTGTELSDAAARHAREMLKLDVRVGPYQPGAFPDSTFDAVYLWHVLEHLPVTRTALSDMRRVLRPGGMLVIAVPNLSSWQARLSRYGWFHLDLPRHYVHLTSEWLLATLRELDFTIV